MDEKSEGKVKIKKVLLIEDQILFREGLESLFRSTPDFEMVGCAGTVYEGIEQAATFKPDIILMDFSLPDGNGLDATRAILAQLPECKIVFLTVYEEDDAFLEALRLGAKGYLLKNVASADLLASLRGLDRGEKAVSRIMMSNALDSFSRILSVEDVKDKLLTKLSPREIDVLRELEGGATNLEIAQRLFLSENTVKHHIGNILDKLGVENRREAAIIARQNTLISKFPSKDKK